MKYIILCFLLLASVLVSLSLGEAFINPLNILSFLFQSGNESDITRHILMEVRFPRVLLAGLVGSTLTLCGGLYQSLFKNPMADPFLLGASSGAALGSTISFLLPVTSFVFLSLSTTTLFAFLGSAITVLLVLALSKASTTSNATIILCGVIISSFLSSITSLLMIFNQDKLSDIIFWVMGSFNGANWDQIIIFIIPLVIILSLYFFYHKEINIIALGEQYATNLGVNTKYFKTFLFLSTSLLIALSVSFCGIIGFVGLIMPNLIRIFFGNNYKILIPTFIIGGGIFMIISDTIARTLLNHMEIPVGIVTSICGAPYFLYLLRKKANQIWK